MIGLAFGCVRYVLKMCQTVFAPALFTLKPCLFRDALRSVIGHVDGPVGDLVQIIQVVVKIVQAHFCLRIFCGFFHAVEDCELPAGAVVSLFSDRGLQKASYFKKCPESCHTVLPFDIFYGALKVFVHQVHTA